MSRNIQVSSVGNISAKLVEKVRLSSQPQLQQAIFVTFPQGEAIHQSTEYSATTVMFGGIIRTHYGYNSVYSCLSDCYGI
jgi:hypothetical protein